MNSKQDCNFFMENLETLISQEIQRRSGKLGEKAKVGEKFYLLGKYWYFNQSIYDHASKS